MSNNRIFCRECGRPYPDREGGTCPIHGTPLEVPRDPRIGTQAGSYLLLDLISTGGMGAVYKAEHVFIKKLVALKILHQSYAENKEILDRFLFEARAAAAINHPNIIDVSDFGHTEDGLPFIVMELLEGGKELLEILEEERRLPLFRAVNILLQVAQALAACHQHGIVHQDLKPENLFVIKKQGHREIVRVVEEGGRRRVVVEKEGEYEFVKVMDFGVANLARRTKSSQVAGTPYYMAPEQIQGIVGDPRSDIYALGVIFYEMLTGSPPFMGDTTEDIFAQHLRAEVPRITRTHPELGLPMEVEELIVRAMAKDPDDRYQSMEEFIRDLKGCLGNTFYSRDIPILLERRGNSLDPKLADDLRKLFEQKGASRRTSSGMRPVVLSRVGSGAQPALRDRPAKPSIDPRLAKDLQKLFSQKKDRKD